MKKLEDPPLFSKLKINKVKKRTSKKDLIINLSVLFITLIILFFISEIILTKFQIYYGKKNFKPVIISKNKTKILVLGESTAYGSNVLTNQTYSANIEKNIPNSIVYNLGYPGITSTKILNNFNGNVQIYNPDIVILNLGNNDFTILNPYATTKKFNVRLLMSKTKTTTLISRFIDSKLGNLAPTFSRYEKTRYRIHINNLIYDFDPEVIENTKNLLEENIIQMDKLCKQNNCQIILLNYLDSYGNYYLENISINNNLPLIKVNVSGDRSHLVSKDGWHPSVIGHEHISNITVDFLKKEGYV